LLQNNVEIAQHKSLKDRCQAAEILKSSQCPAPVMVDTMENEATKAYAAFPERLFIVQQGKVVYEGGTGPYNYDLTEVRRWLEEYRQEQLKVYWENKLDGWIRLFTTLFICSFKRSIEFVYTYLKEKRVKRGFVKLITVDK